MFNYISPYFAAETADTIEEGDKWYTNKSDFRRPPELLPRDEVARAINSEVKAGRGSPHGGVFLDIASRRAAEEITRRLPSMYHQFKELADVDITTEPMEVGPTCHYIMGGVRVDADTAATTVAGLYAAGEVRRRHARRQPPRWQLAVRPPRLRRRAGVAAAEYALGRPAPWSIDEGQVTAATQHALTFFEHERGRQPLHRPRMTCRRRCKSSSASSAPRASCSRPRASSSSSSERAAERVGRGQPLLQPGLAPRPRPRVDAGLRQCTTLGGDRARRRAGAGTPGRTTPKPDPELGKVNMVARGSTADRSSSVPEAQARHAGRARRAVRGGQVMDRGRTNGRR